ncbi:MAG: glycosyltransferase family 4 protein [Microbacteriaceae bacterium]
MSRVLIVTGDPIGPRMAGPAIRAWNMARILGAEHEVTLVTTTNLEPVDAPFALERVLPSDQTGFAELMDWCEVVVFQGHARTQFEALRDTDKIVVADVYVPINLEMLEQGRELPAATWNLMVDRARHVLNDQLATADYFLCASDRQRIFYLGQLSALGRITPATYQNDPHLDRLLGVVPYGLEATPPEHTRDVLRGVVPGIEHDDKVLIWGGGIYSWFDPLTLIRAVARLRDAGRPVRLYFLGTKHPGVDKMRIVSQAEDLAQQLGVLGTAVFFNDGWIDYSDRQNYLLEADAGVSTHHLHVETTVSFRTRILDYLWAGLPMVVTRGDSMAELIEREGLGVAVEADDVDSLTAGLETVLFDEDAARSARENVARVREDFVWESALAPLVEFLRDPAPAADRGLPRASLGDGPKAHGLGHDIGMAWHHLRYSGLRTVLQKVARRVSRRDR